MYCFRTPGRRTWDSHPLPEKMLLRSLRKAQHAVRADVKRALEGEAIALARLGEHVAAPMTSNQPLESVRFIVISSKRRFWLRFPDV